MEPTQPHLPAPPRIHHLPPHAAAPLTPSIINGARSFFPHVINTFQPYAITLICNYLLLRSLASVVLIWCIFHSYLVETTSYFRRAIPAADVVPAAFASMLDQFVVLFQFRWKASTPCSWFELHRKIRRRFSSF